MRILVYETNFASSGIDYPIKNVLNNLGHYVEMFDWKKYYFASAKCNICNRVKNRLLVSLIYKQINHDLVDVITKNKFDLFLVMRGEHIYPDTLDIARKYIKYIFNWNTDDLFNKLNSSKYLISSLNKYDIHFTPRMHLQDEYYAKGVKCLKHIDWYYKEELAISKFPEHTYHDADIRFIGSMSEHRLYFLKKLSDLDCHIYGWGWRKRKIRNLHATWSLYNPVGQKEMIDLFKKTKINLNILTLENRDRTNIRLFDIPSVGGFQLCERSEGVLQIFKEDKEVVCFSSSDELRDKCIFYLKNDSIREKIARAGFERVVSGKFTLTGSVMQILNEIKIS